MLDWKKGQPTMGFSACPRGHQSWLNKSCLHTKYVTRRAKQYWTHFKNWTLKWWFMSVSFYCIILCFVGTHFHLQNSNKPRLYSQKTTIDADTVCLIIYVACYGANRPISPPAVAKRISISRYRYRNFVCNYSQKQIRTFFIIATLALQTVLILFNTNCLSIYLHHVFMVNYW